MPQGVRSALSILLTAIAILPTAGTAAAQELRLGPGGEPPLDVPMVQGSMELDGVLDEPFWDGAAVIDGGIMHLPDFGSEPTEHTEWLLAHDGLNFYLGCRVYDSEPDQIRIATLERDISTFNTDACGIRVDSYNDEENALLFNVTPASVRTDWTFANDAQGRPNMDWDAFWDAAGTLRDFGWSGEMRIPFSSMGFQTDDQGRVVMGFMLARSISRRSETTVHPAVPPNWGPSSMAKPSQMRKMVMRGVEASNPVYVTPYALGGSGLDHELNEPGTGYDRNTESVAEIGGDVRYGVTRNLTLDLTVNTDFAQVEADNQQVNLTRFSLFFPEQRRFFQERAAIFEFPLSFQERLFHSRRIGLVDGDPVRIYGGARLVGRVGDWDVGFLDMQTAEHEPSGTPSENMGVLRLRRRVINSFSYVGGLVTSRIGEGGGYNVLYGTDGVFRLFGQDYLTVNWSQSFDDADDDGGADPEAFDRSLVRLDWQRRGTDGLTYQTGILRAGADFDPGMGFLRRRDYLQANAGVGYGWRPDAGSALNRYGVRMNSNLYERNADNTTESADVQLQADLDTRGGHGLTANLNRRYEDLTRNFTLADDAFVPVGSYWFTEASLNYNPPMSALLRLGAQVSGGTFYDGTRISGQLNPGWSVNRHLRLTGTYEYNHVEFDDRAQDFTAHLLRARTDVTFTVHTSASAFVQYNSAEDVVLANFRFHWNPREGNDLYVVWNENLNSDTESLLPLGPELPRTRSRTLLVKYAHTFTLDL